MTRHCSLLLLACLCLFVSCLAHHPVPQGPFATPPTASGALDGSRNIDLLARGFLPRPERPGVGFGFYSYLVFSERSEATLEPRRAAAKAFLCMLRDVSSLESLGIPPEEMALLLAPVLGSPRDLDPSVDQFLDTYDYETGFLLRQAVSSVAELPSPPSVSIIGSPTQIWYDSVLPGAEVSVVDLTGPPAQIEARILGFRDGFNVGEERIAMDSWNLLDLVRAVFESVGEFVEVAVAPEAQATEISSCR